jgi:hypothetical protein
MKILRIALHSDIHQVIEMIDLLDRYREALINAYADELSAYQQAQAELAEQDKCLTNRDLFEDLNPF